MAKKRNKKRFAKNCKAGITSEMWITLQKLKVKTGKSKAQIIREAIDLYNETH